MEKIKTAAYCRVSTDKEEQDGSYEVQEQHFTDLINANPAMEFAGIYGDRGRSGLRKAGRPGLRRLMDDCGAGKVQLILTKSISRFARNMAECAEMIRELRRLGVNIVFEEQNLNSRDTRGDLVLNIFAAIAEEESRSISRHAILAHEQYALEGRPFGRIAYGYRDGGGLKWVINEEQAPLVRRAFELAAEGQNYSKIRKALEEMDGHPWTRSRVKYMLTNVVYKGDYSSHKSICVVPGKLINNTGQRDRIYIEEHHEPIVPPELFDRVQEIIRRGILLSYKRPSREDEEFLERSRTWNAQ